MSPEALAGAARGTSSTSSIDMVIRTERTFLFGFNFSPPLNIFRLWTVARRLSTPFLKKYV
jgi:hypothetical protein